MSWSLSSLWVKTKSVNNNIGNHKRTVSASGSGPFKFDRVYNSLVVDIYFLIGDNIIEIF
jgi:hypothetical protein